jgi:hypothetical protein
LQQWLQRCLGCFPPAPTALRRQTRSLRYRRRPKIVFTQYDDGNAFARFMLAGLGQIHIDGTVVFTDATTGREIGKYKVSKDFAFGGIYGVATHIEDVEKGFARSVAAILDNQQATIAAHIAHG